jgi:hypothetical protein
MGRASCRDWLVGNSNFVGTAWVNGLTAHSVRESRHPPANADRYRTGFEGRETSRSSRQPIPRLAQGQVARGIIQSGLAADKVDFAQPFPKPLVHNDLARTCPQCHLGQIRATYDPFPDPPLKLLLARTCDDFIDPRKRSTLPPSIAKVGGSQPLEGIRSGLLMCRACRVGCRLFSGFGFCLSTRRCRPPRCWFPTRNGPVWESPSPSGSRAVRGDHPPPSIPEFTRSRTPLGLRRNGF